MSDHEKIQQTVSKMRYRLLKTALDSNLHLSEIAKRSGVNRRRLRKIFWTDCDFNIREIAVIANACEADISFRLTERDDWNAKLGLTPRKRCFTGHGIELPD